MAMIKCAECGTEISDKAAACVKCGAPLKPRPSSSSPINQSVSGGQGLIVLIVVAGAIWYIAGSGDSASSAADPHVVNAPAAAPAKPPIRISATDLKAAYDKNEVAADIQYKGRTLIVNGVIASIDKDFMDSPVVNLASDNEFMHVMAKFDKSDAARLAQLHKGDQITLTCVGNGRIVGSPVLKCAP